MDFSTSEYTEDGGIRVDAGKTVIPKGNSKHAEIVAMAEAGEITIAPYVAPDPLVEWRASAFTPKDKFLANCADIGLITDQEAIDGARGIWPPSFDAALSGLPAKGARNAKMEFATAVNVHRANPLVAMVGEFAGLSDEQIDGLFQ